MIERCTKPYSNRWEHYGGRGIRVCEEWLNSFEAFRDWAHANGYHEGFSIDRININRNYEPDNCQWLTVSENTYKQHHIDRASKKAG
jgi:hypothetical protein